MMSSFSVKMEGKLRERILQKTLAFEFLKFPFPKSSCPHLYTENFKPLHLLQNNEGTIAEERR